MKRIIIPAGTVSGKKDYILEIPIDQSDQENEEDAIYILEDKSSKSSYKSLSDYFYDDNISSYSNQDCLHQYPIEQLSEVYLEPDKYQHPSVQSSYYSSNTNPYSANNGAMKAEYDSAELSKQNKMIPSYEYSEAPMQSKLSYYKSLGFTDAELHKILSKNNGGLRKSRFSHPRKFMRFNRLGVSDFLSPISDQLAQQKADLIANSTNFPSDNVNAYNNMASVETATSFNMPFSESATTRAHKRALQLSNNAYKSSAEYYGKQPLNQNINPKAYQQFEIKENNRSIRNRSNSPVRFDNNIALDVAYNIPQLPYDLRGNARPDQQAYHDARYYSKPSAAPKVGSTIKKKISNNSNENPQTSVGQAGLYEQRSNQSKMNNLYQYCVQPNEEVGYTMPVGDEYQDYPKKHDDYQKQTFRQLPGTSVVSNPASVKIRNA